jgi:hypothetical protein
MLDERGDLLVNREGPECACTYWRNIECLDMKTDNVDSDHIAMLV